MNSPMSTDAKAVICFQCGGPESSAGDPWPDCAACRARRIDAVPAPFAREAPIYQGDFGRHVEEHGPAPALTEARLGEFDDDPDQPA